MDLKLPLTRTQLDETICPCGKPHCKADPILFLKPVCCDGATEVFFDKRDGSLTIQCYHCKKQVCRVLVANSLFET